MIAIRRFAGWVFWETPLPLGPLAPYVLGLSMGRMPRRVIEEDDEIEPIEPDDAIPKRPYDPGD